MENGMMDSSVFFIMFISFLHLYSLSLLWWLSFWLLIQWLNGMNLWL